MLELWGVRQEGCTYSLAGKTFAAYSKQSMPQSHAYRSCEEFRFFCLNSLCPDIGYGSTMRSSNTRQRWVGGGA
eukprot:3932112-Rhodomonas_salina.1